ncbi:MAG: class I SAM-dependent methyltransferase [Chitinophagaceae bacterium]
MTLYTDKYSGKVGGASGYAGFRNRRRLDLLTKLIVVIQDDKILEIGPNTCLLLNAFKEKARSIVGIELNEAIVNKLGRPELLCMDATNMTFGDDSFNVVIGIEVFEHISALQKVFSEIARVLVPGGKCYMTVPFELFRGQQALGDAWYTFRDLRMARKLHVHKLNPGKIKKMITHTSLVMITSELIWIPGPSYFIVLQNSK